MKRNQIVEDTEWITKITALRIIRDNFVKYDDPKLFIKKTTEEIQAINSIIVFNINITTN